MTKTEAIAILEMSKRMATNGRMYNQAIGMAIEALQNRPTPCEKCVHVKSCRKVIILKNRTYKLIKYCSQGVERKGGDAE